MPTCPRDQSIGMSRILQILFAFALAWTMAPAWPCHATVMSEGEPPSWLGIGLNSHRTSDATYRLVIAYGSLLDGSAKVRLDIPSALEIVVGSPVIRSPISSEDRVQTLLLRARRDGAYRIRGTLTVDRATLG